MTELIEGWGDMRPGDRVYHYMIPGGWSLCGKIGFHSMHPDTLTAHGKSMEPGRDDCRPCFRKLMKRLTVNK